MKEFAYDSPQTRFLQLLDVVWREGRHLDYSRAQIVSFPLDAQWVMDLENRPEDAEKVEAFVSRFSRMQDTFTDKLLPRWLMALEERPGAVIDTLNRAEQLGIVADVEQWLALRRNRNRLVHEYMTDPEAFAQALRAALAFVEQLFATYNRLRYLAEENMPALPGPLPPKLPAKEDNP